MSERTDDARPSTYVSINIEASGPNPTTYSMLSIGACLVIDPARGFYVELQPVSDAAVESAMAIGGLSLERLRAEGTEPAMAMAEFERWLAAETPDGNRPVFVGFNAPFDWMFVADYFERYLGRNPFGHSAIDIKSFYMGLKGVPWAGTSMRFLAPLYLSGRHLSHNALSDARDQAELFREMLAESTQNR